jgi:hypothetical protein
MEIMPIQFLKLNMDGWQNPITPCHKNDASRHTFGDDQCLMLSRLLLPSWNNDADHLPGGVLLYRKQH